MVCKRLKYVEQDEGRCGMVRDEGGNGIKNPDSEKRGVLIGSFLDGDDDEDDGDNEKQICESLLIQPF